MIIQLYFLCVCSPETHTYTCMYTSTHSHNAHPSHEFISKCTFKNWNSIHQIWYNRNQIRLSARLPPFLFSQLLYVNIFIKAKYPGGSKHLHGVSRTSPGMLCKCKRIIKDKQIPKWCPNTSTTKEDQFLRQTYIQALSDNTTSCNQKQNVKIMPQKVVFVLNKKEMCANE